jgi:riboflavin kinase / FMN adenylyltransferase
MNVYRNLDELEKGIDSVLTIGTFDGLHRGHRSIIEAVVNTAEKHALRSVVLTFDPHPREIINKHESGRLYLLTSIEERLEFISELGIDACLVLPFTRELSLISAKEFFETIVAGTIGASRIVVGEDHAFGKGREGNAEALRKMASEIGIEATIVGKLDLGGQKISSSATRRALQRGDVHSAAQQLGREYSLTGVVVKGDGIGHKMGFATANIELRTSKKLLPATGVYAVKVVHDGQEYTGMMNIGRKPTVSDRDKIWLEVHIFKFDKTIYGEYLTVHFVERIRDERKFHSREDLVKQLEKDKTSALALLDSKKTEQSN